MESMKISRFPLPLEPVHHRDPPRLLTARNPKISAIRRRTNRKREHHKMYHSSTPTGSEQQDPFLEYFNGKSTTFGPHAGCVFMVFRRKGPVARVVDIPVKCLGSKGNPSEHEIFRDLKREFEKHSRPWVWAMKLRKVSAVRPVQFRFIQRAGSGFFVSLLDADFRDQRSKYQTRLDVLSGQLDRYTDPEDFCCPNLNNDGQYEHTHGACGFFDATLSFEPSCPFEEWDMLRADLYWFDTLSFLTCYFLHPDAAQDQILLSRPNMESFLYRYSTIRFRSQRERRFEVLNGLYIEEQWEQSRAIPLVVAMFLITIVVSRAIWSSWEVVFGATSCVGAMMSLVYALHDE